MHLDYSLLTFYCLGAKPTSRVSRDRAPPAVKADTGREYMNQELTSSGHTEVHVPEGQHHWKETLYHSDWGRLLMTGER